MLPIKMWNKWINTYVVSDDHMQMIPWLQILSKNTRKVEYSVGKLTSWCEPFFFLFLEWKLQYHVIQLLQIRPVKHKMEVKC